MSDDPDDIDSLNAELLRQDLEDRLASDATIASYMAIARRFEDFAAHQHPPVDLDAALLSRPKLVELAEQWGTGELSSASVPTLRTYRAALTSYLRVIDPGIETRHLDLGLARRLENESQKWAGRRRPSDPLTDRQVRALRRKLSRLPADQAWRRTLVELALSGLSWSEIEAARSDNFGPYGDQPRITFIERTIPIGDLESSHWLAACANEHFPGRAGQGISLRKLKSQLSRDVGRSRGPEYGAGQGLRTLHNTGVRRAIRRGLPLEKVAAIYRRRIIPESWKQIVPARAALPTAGASEPPPAADTASARRGRVLLSMDDQSFDESVLRVRSDDLSD